MMQAITACLRDDVVDAENSPAALTSASKPINIASVRATSLRTCGLRAAARVASSIVMGSSPQIASSPSLSKRLSSNLSYTNSQEPGENSQLNAFAMVDKLVDFNAGFMWQTPDSSKVAEQLSVKGSQSAKGLQSLARIIGIKNRQDKIGIFDWIDSQSDDNGKVSSIFSIEPQHCVHTSGQREGFQAAISDKASVKDLNSTLLTAQGPHPKQQRSLKCRHGERGSVKVTMPTEGSTNFNGLLFNSKQNIEEENAIENEVHDLDENHLKENIEFMDIGVNTQIALEAMDIMKHGALRGTPDDTIKVFPMFDIGNDTQTALDAMDILRCSNELNSAPLYEKKRGENKALRQQNRGEVSKLNQTEEANVFFFSITSGKEGELLSRASTCSKPIGKKSFSRGALKTSKKFGKSVSLKQAGPDVKDNKQFYLDFSSVLVPRKKRSRLCSPRLCVNENIEVLGWHKSGPLLHEAHQEAHKPINSEGRKNVAWAGNSAELTVLTESTNDELCRPTKRELPVKWNCSTSLEQSRKRRKCESRSIFVLFSHSLSEATIKQQKKTLKRLGGHVATSAEKATHFVADVFARSINMLIMMAAGKMVVTTNWLEGCSQAEYFLNEESYILTDAQKEKEWGFCMHSSLAASRRKPLLKGMKVVVSPNVVPDFTAMKALIESAGGQVLQKLSISSQSKPVEITSVSFILASDQDYDLCVDYVRKGCRVYSTELIVHGIVVQNLDFSRNRLFLENLT